VDPEEQARLEARLAELDRRLDETHDGYAPYGPNTLKWARERGRLMRELERNDEGPSRGGLE